MITRGINRAKRNKYEKGICLSENYNDEKIPCIFLSHRSLDKDMVRELGEYINDMGIDIYLDERDEELQRATEEGDDERITELIKEGINNSTHIMCIISKNTINSWWVPYEIGVGDSRGKSILVLKLNDIESIDVPSYLKINKFINNSQELDYYLFNLINRDYILQEDYKQLLNRYDNLKKYIEIR